ncbi:MAG: GNAT family N-acetyltransferase [Anaerolineae bacterium]|nr:GNAT family N-acetyltransferase [Anaerolineae bacterium]
MSQNSHDTETFPAITTSRLVLRAMTPGDATELVRHFGNPAVAEYIASRPIRTLEQANEWLKWMGGFFAAEQAIRVAITLHDDTFIGCGGLYDWKRDAHYASLGYNIIPDYRGEGYSLEVVRALIDFGRNALKLNRIEAEVVQGNAAVQRVLEKLGFRQEGVLRQRLLKGGKYYDVCLMGLLLRDYAPALP